MIRVAQILGKMNGGGAEQMVMNYYRAIDRTQVQFDFYIFKGSKYVPAEEIKNLGGRLFVLPSFRRPLRYYRTLKRLHSENGYDIVHCHLSTLSWLPLLAAKGAGSRVRIVHNHSTSGGREELVRNIAKALFKPFAKINATDFFACSELASRWMYGSIVCGGLNDDDNGNKRVRIMPNAIDTQNFAFSEEKRRNIRKKLKISEDTLVFGHIGRFCPQKNQNFLLDIFEEILKQEPNSRLLLAGTGPDMEQIRARIMVAGITDKVVLLGQRSDPEKLYCAFDCFVMPSNYEGLPVVGVEAQCSGVYCLFSDKITSEVKLTSASQFLSLRSGAADWACAALCCAKIRNENALEQVRNAGFEISGAAEQLKEFYLNR